MEQNKRENEALRDAIRGCLTGGAAGDALGYAVEFKKDREIFAIYGPAGITAYDLHPIKKKALISDDTQMTLFTANGLLLGETRWSVRGVGSHPRVYVERAYQNWLLTQRHSHEEIEQSFATVSWLCRVPDLCDARAPGNTCMSGLRSRQRKRGNNDYIKNRINQSKGCGGVMRVAPVGLIKWSDMDAMDMEAAQIAAITHSHSLGYMPAAVLCHIVSRIVYPGGERRSLKEIVLEARNAAARLFADDEHIGELTALIDRAACLAENDRDDLANIRALGEGWVGDEALAIAIYCSLRHEHDFSGGIIAAVNHSGDSDSTGAVTGNILGAMAGYDAIDEKWKTDLECADVIEQIADDLLRINDEDFADDDAWLERYDC